MYTKFWKLFLLTLWVLFVFQMNPNADKACVYNSQDFNLEIWTFWSIWIWQRNRAYERNNAQHISVTAGQTYIFKSLTILKFFGSIERNHSVLNEFLLSIANDYEWVEWSTYFIYNYHTWLQVDTNYTSFNLVYLLTDTLRKNLTKVNNFDYYLEEKNRLKSALNRAKELTIKKKIEFQVTNIGKDVT